MKDILKKIKINSLQQEQKELNTLNLDFTDKSSEKLNINNNFYTPKNPVFKKEPFLNLGNRENETMKSKKFVDVKENNKTTQVEELNLPVLNPCNMNSIPSLEQNVMKCFYI